MKTAVSSLFFILPFFLMLHQSSPQELMLFLGAALLHESGHLFALHFLGYRPRRFSLSLAGAIISADLSLVPYRKEFLIYIAGPFMNGVGMLVAFLFLRQSFTFPALYFFFCNALFCFLNLLPVQGLDGYQALLACLSIFLDEDRARAILLPFHRTFLLLLAAGGTAAWIYWKNISLLLFSSVLILEGQTKKATENS